uniref:Uncharacterized protein n=1 Tax=Ditylenchus dipsaci TaxID=166011 RepID=A0A915DMF3_9BILA
MILQACCAFSFNSQKLKATSKMALNLHGYADSTYAVFQFISDVLFEEGRGIFRQKLPPTPNKEYQERMSAMQSLNSQSTETKSE